MTDSPTEPHHGSRAAAISNLVVRVVSEYTGRGPTGARTHIGEDLVTVVLRDTLTKGERSLVRDGREALVLTMRKAFQDTMRADLVAGIEDAHGPGSGRVHERQPHRSGRGSGVLRAQARSGHRTRRRTRPGLSVETDVSRPVSGLLL